MRFIHKILEENNIKLERKIEEIYFYFPISERKKEKEKRNRIGKNKKLDCSWEKSAIKFNI